MRRLSPYFRSLAKQKRLCPRCGKAALTVEPTLSPDYAYDTCPRCGYMVTIGAPPEACVDEPELPSPIESVEERDGGRIIHIDFGRS